MAKILIHPFASKLQSGKMNAKSFPYWRELKVLLHQQGHTLTQIGTDQEEDLDMDEFKKNLPMDEVRKEINNHDFFIACDSFIPHMGATEGVSGIVIFSKSDPKIFGYEFNDNLVKPEHLRSSQHAVWSEVPWVKEAFVKPEEIAVVVEKWAKGE